MEDDDQKALDNRLRNIEKEVDGWSEPERRARSKIMIAQLISMGATIDAQLEEEINRFNTGTIGFEEMSAFLQRKFNK